MFKLVSTMYLSCFHLSYAYKEASDGSVCFNNCNRHGDCIDYTCHCHLGFHGDDCSTTFITEDKYDGSSLSTHIIPILSAGQSNLTSTNYSTKISKAMKSKSNPLLLVGFSSPGCYKCIRVETEYLMLNERLKDINVSFYRANADHFKELCQSLSIHELPSLVIYLRKNQPIVYQGPQHHVLVFNYIKKLLLKSPFYSLSSLAAIQSFLFRSLLGIYPPESAGSDITSFVNVNGSDSSNDNDDHLLEVSAIKIIGFFKDPKGLDEDEYSEFTQVASDMKAHTDMYFGVVTNKSLFKYFVNGSSSSSSGIGGFRSRKSAYNTQSNEITVSESTYGWLDKTPSVCIIVSVVDHDQRSDPIERSAPQQQQQQQEQLADIRKPKCISFSELSSLSGSGSGSGTRSSPHSDWSLSSWILSNSVPLVAQLTPANFGFYEKSNKPMLLLFLDLTHSAQTRGPLVVGGHSGGVLNELLLQEFRAVARAYEGYIQFVYVDGEKYPMEMKKLGLFTAGGGTERLPLMAFNTKNDLQLPFPDDLPFSRETIGQFCAAFINGQLKGADDLDKMAKKALQLLDQRDRQLQTVGNNNDLKLNRGPKKRVVLEQKRGVLEFFGDEFDEVSPRPSTSTSKKREEVCDDNGCGNDAVCAVSASSTGGTDSETAAVTETAIDSSESQTVTTTHTSSISGSSSRERTASSSTPTATAIVKVTLDTFHALVTEEEELDVALLLYTTDLPVCGHFIVYFKRMAERLFDLRNVSDTLRIARMDVTEEVPPPEINKDLLIGKSLPVFVMFPAHRKQPPHSFYSGTSSVKNMMEWVASQVTHPLDMPRSLPHLTAEQRQQYREQVREREERVHSEAREARLAESRAQYDDKLYRHNQRIKQLQQQEQQQ